MAARLSLRLPWIAAALSVAMLAPAAAHAEKLETLALTETNPKSSALQPAGSLTPSIIGRGDSVITTVVNPGGGKGFPITRALDPKNEVAIYTNEACTGAPVATGNLGELEAVGGIQVEVAPDSITTFYATESDPSHLLETSDCSTPGLTYWHSSTAVTPPTEPPATDPSSSDPPPAENRSANAPLPPRLRTAPSGSANDNSPRVFGSAPGADSVKLFTNSSCSGAPAVKVFVDEFAAGVELRVADNSVTDFAGISIANGKQSVCSPPATYIEDSTPPRTRITMGPGAKTRHRKVVFRFADVGGDPIGTSFLCKVDRGKWKSCHSPFKLRHLSYHRHILRVRGTDVIGNSEAKAAKRGFKVIH
jgi:hypothetical protein